MPLAFVFMGVLFWLTVVTVAVALRGMAFLTVAAVGAVGVVAHALRDAAHAAAGRLHRTAS